MDFIRGEYRSGVVWLSAFCGLLLLLTGCGGSLPNTDQGVRDQILLLGNGAEPKSLDPHIATGVTENKIISALTEGLVAHHPSDDNAVEPGVAERWEHNEDYSVWTFFLNPRARWSNGDTVTAHDFVFSFQRMLSPALAAEYGQMLFIMKNAQEFHSGTVSDFADVGAKALDDHTLQLTLVGPTPFFLSMLMHYSWFPVHPPTIEQHGGMTDRDGRWTLPGNHVGNGPFMLAEWRPNQFIKVVPNPYYWDRDVVRLNAIYYMVISDANTERRMFDSGRLHVTNTLPSNDINWFRNNRPEVLRISPYLGTYFYRFNVTRAPLNDVRVRQALSKAIDRELLVEAVVQGGQQPAFGYVPPGFNDYETPHLVEFNPEEARRLLAEAGFPNGRGFPRKTILFNTLEDHRKIAEAIAAMWREHLNIQVDMENKEWKVYLDAQTNLQYDIARAGWIGDYMDPITFLEMWTTGNGNNNTGWSNADYDRIIAEAFRSHSPETHFGKLLEAETILLTEMPITPLYWYNNIRLIDPRVRGWYNKLLDNRPWKHVYLAD
ncbi:MAG: peptide ABC transporter substrate-binding protein [Verrucomicrobia bacterium]|nr:peptide ABC transporter substrate-binding protein [Verrucomicrobiota bacterium]